MDDEIISNIQGICLVAILIIGTSSIMVMGIEAKQDAWLAIILALLMAFPIILVYARLRSIFIDKNLFDILEICFGKYVGKGIVILYSWFVLHNAALVLENTGRFMTTVSLTETPLMPPMIGVSIVSMWAVKKGTKVIGRLAQSFFIVMGVFMFISILLMIPKMEVKNILPIACNGIRPIIKGAFSAFAFPFGETLVFTMFFSNFKDRKSPYLVYVRGVLIGGLIMLTIALTDIMVLGVNSASITYYPSYAVSARLKIGQSLQRLEVIIAVVYLLGATMKISILLLATCKGIAKIFSLIDYRVVALPFSLLILNLAYFHDKSTMDIFEWVTNVWPYYAFPFQVILPITIWIIAEVKVKNI